MLLKDFFYGIDLFVVENVLGLVQIPDLGTQDEPELQDLTPMELRQCSDRIMNFHRYNFLSEEAKVLLLPIAIRCDEEIKRRNDVAKSQFEAEQEKERQKIDLLKQMVPVGSFVTIYMEGSEVADSKCPRKIRNQEPFLLEGTVLYRNRRFKVMDYDRDTMQVELAPESQNMCKRDKDSKNKQIITQVFKDTFWVDFGGLFSYVCYDDAMGGKVSERIISQLIKAGLKGLENE